MFDDLNIGQKNYIDYLGPERATEGYYSRT